ncbi:MAG TPA: hypothetical protein VGN18_00860 [Jatrophihabitans sp.]|uniref:hypothetical protein n=1 Tax=Jatrophihabitans sp. TaxID=1932789 RepID=UPI002E07DA64|nr:hypothetical protein [Jatrophihabitans sp.]
MTPELLFLYCPTCARESLAESPPCPDGHGDDCPDHACVECGTALADAMLVQIAVPVAPRSRRRAA